MKGGLKIGARDKCTANGDVLNNEQGGKGIYIA